MGVGRPSVGCIVLVQVRAGPGEKASVKIVAAEAGRCGWNRSLHRCRRSAGPADGSGLNNTGKEGMRILMGFLASSNWMSLLTPWTMEFFFKFICALCFFFFFNEVY